MNEMFLLMSLFFGMQNIDLMHYNINLNNLYYKTDNSYKKLDCEMVYIPFEDSEDEKRIISIIKKEELKKIYKDHLQIEDGKGILININNLSRDSINEEIDKLIKLKLRIVPVFTIDNDYVVYKGFKEKQIFNNTFINIKCKKFVDENLISKYIKDKFSFKTFSFKKIKPGLYEFCFENNINYNKLQMANLLAEDNIWFEYAQPTFELFRDPIHVDMFLDDRCNTNIGSEKKLIIKITYYNKDIIIKDDMIPAIGRNFFPQPVGEEKFYSFKEHKIKRYTIDNKNVIEITYPFKYYSMSRAIYIDNVNFRYELNNKPMNYLYDKFFVFYVNFLTKESNITDIFSKTNQSVDLAHVDIKKIDESYSRSELKVALIVLFMFLVGYCLTMYEREYFRKTKNITNQSNYVNITEELINNITLENWKDEYLKIYEFVKLTCDKNNLQIKDQEIYKELNKLYAEKEMPDLLKLKDSYKEFMGKLNNV